MKTLYLRLISLLFLCLLTGFNVSAQRRFGYRPTRFGITGGLNLTGLKYTPSENSPAAKSRPLTSFQAGVLVDYQITNWMSLEPEFLVTGKGANFKIKDRMEKTTYKMHPWFLEVPVNLLFRSSLGYRSNLFFGGGPYIAFALGGKGEYEGPANTNPYFSDHRLKFGNGSQKDMRMIDLGLNFKAGVEFNRNLRIGAQYGLGLRNLAPEKNEEGPDILKNRAFSVTLTILFGRSYRPFY